MWDPEDTAKFVIVIAVVVVVGGFIAGAGLWKWQDEQDKRACRQAGGAVELLPDNHTDWHCVGARPETAP